MAEGIKQTKKLLKRKVLPRSVRLITAGKRWEIAGGDGMHCRWLRRQRDPRWLHPPVLGQYERPLRDGQGSPGCQRPSQRCMQGRKCLSSLHSDPIQPRQDC